MYLLLPSPPFSLMTPYTGCWGGPYDLGNNIQGAVKDAEEMLAKPVVDEMPQDCAAHFG